MKLDGMFYLNMRTFLQLTSISCKVIVMLILFDYQLLSLPMMKSLSLHGNESCVTFSVIIRLGLAEARVRFLILSCERMMAFDRVRPNPSSFKLPATEISTCVIVMLVVA